MPIPPPWRAWQKRHGFATFAALRGPGPVIERSCFEPTTDVPFAASASVAFAPSGELLVVDALHFRIARFDADGRWLGAFGTAAAEGGEFGMPKDVAADAEGRVYVSDAQRDAVLVFRPDGTLDYVLGASGEGPGRFTHPAGVASSAGRIYVADSYAGRVQAFDILGAPR